MTITQRDVYIAVKRERAQALRDAARTIPADLQVGGHKPHIALIGAASAAEDAAEWAESKTPVEFNGERFKP